MAAYERSLVPALADRLADRSDLIIAIFGPRQSGKTTAIRQALDRCALPALYHAVDAVSAPGSAAGRRGHPLERDGYWLAARWEEARREARRRGAWVVLVLDEVQD